MASPHGSHTHGSASPAATLGSQPQYGYQQQQQQQQQQQYPQSNATYESGLMPANEFYGKEVVDPATQQQQAQHHQHQQNMHQEDHQQQQVAGYAPVYQQPTPQDELPPSKDADKRICGVRRTTFLLALLAAVLLAGVIGAAAAAGIVAGKNSNSAAPATTPADSTSSAAPSGSSSSTAAAPTGSFTAIPLPDEPSGLGITRPLCPGSNKTYTTVEGTDLRFYHECGINYPFNDLGNVPMTSMSDCLIQCAAQYIRPQGAAGPCLGVSWPYGKRQGVDGEACYLKYAKGPATYENEQVESAFLVDS